MTDPILEVRNLAVSFRVGRASVRVLEDVSFDVGRGEVVGIVGESGSGKSVTALAVMGLLADAGTAEAKSVRLDGRDLFTLDREAMRRVRGREMAMIFQEPMSSLNPLYSVGFQVAEVLEEHQGMTRKGARAKAIELLERVGIPDPAERVSSYPHELSGGMRQRVMIAMAVACRPKLLIADEPTTALDVTIQAQILELIRELRRDLGMATLLVSHDMGVIASMSDRVLVLYAGQIVEEGSAAEVFRLARHPYTRLLMKCVPTTRERRERLEVIHGTAPAPTSFPSACRFHPRCPDAVERCKVDAPALERHTDGRVRCWLAGELV